MVALREQLDSVRSALAESEKKKTDADEQRVSKLTSEIEALNKVRTFTWQLMLMFRKRATLSAK
jgi:hypothetical protein